MTTIDNNNYELWLVRYAEGDLDADGRRAVEAWLAAHPEAAEELALYQEAPRLERDERIRYTAPEPRRLWPALVRWSAVAAVIVALMMPAMRMGGLATLPPQEETAPLLASATIPPAPETVPPTPIAPRKPNLHNVSGTSGVSGDSSFSSSSSSSSISSISSSSSSSGISGGHSAPIPSSDLIAFEPEDEILASQSLIAFESADWGDRLLALNDATHENLALSPSGRLVNRLLPDSRQLEEHVVDPLRQRIDNLKNKRK